MAKYKYFLFSDTHGCFDFLIRDLEKAGFNIDDKSHILVGLGDYFDRGEQNDKLFKFFTSDKLKNRIYLVYGNHDDMLYKFLAGWDDGYFNCIYNGMYTTIENFAGVAVNLMMLQMDPDFYRKRIRDNFPALSQWLRTLKPGFQIDNFKVMHAGMTKIATEDDNSYTWNIDNWTKTPEFIDEHKDDGFMYIVGHWHARALSEEFYNQPSDQIFIYKHFIGLDACANASKFVNIFVLDSDSLPTVLE